MQLKKKEKDKKLISVYEDNVGLLWICTLPSRLPKYALLIILMNKPVSTTPEFE